MHSWRPRGAGLSDGCPPRFLILPVGGGPCVAAPFSFCLVSPYSLWQGMVVPSGPVSRETSKTTALLVPSLPPVLGSIGIRSGSEDHRRDSVGMSITRGPLQPGQRQPRCPTPGYVPVPRLETVGHAVMIRLAKTQWSSPQRTLSRPFQSWTPSGVHFRTIYRWMETRCRAP